MNSQMHLLLPWLHILRFKTVSSQLQYQMTHTYATQAQALNKRRCPPLLSDNSKNERVMSLLKQRIDDAQVRIE
jgi:hypothetical protein